MIDPFDIKTPMNPRESQELITFIVCVANATAVVVAPRVDAMLKEGGFPRYEPFTSLSLLDRHEHRLEGTLAWHGIGCYTQKAARLRRLINYPEMLQSLKLLERYIGPKSARMFVLYTQPHRDDIAVLDRHQLAWLRGRGYPGAPRDTPSRGWAYTKWELTYLSECRREGLSPRDMDEVVFATYGRRILQWTVGSSSLSELSSASSEPSATAELAPSTVSTCPGI